MMFQNALNCELHFSIYVNFSYRHELLILVPRNLGVLPGFLHGFTDGMDMICLGN